MKVKNGSCIRHLSFKTLMSAKKRNIIAVLAIALTALLFTSLFTIVMSINETNQNYQFRSVGGYAHGSFKDVDEDQIAVLSAHPDVKAVGVRTVLGLATQGAFEKDYAEVSYMDDNNAKWSFSQPTVGRTPKSGNEITMDTKALELLGVKPELGAQVKVTYTLADKEQMGWDITDTFTLVGWWDYDELLSVHFLNVSKEYAQKIEKKAVALSVFGAWQWVDSKLNRSDWLTDTPNTPASTWLILGSDERDGSTDYGGVDNISGFRTDTILVLIKPKSGPSSLVSIPRDSLMNVDNQYMKINAVALIAGKKALVSNVEQITGQKIDHVAQIKFGGLQNVVNALGGIELCYDEDVQDSYSGLNWKAGCHTADGSTALSFSRMRYADARGDFGRNERQRQVISAIVKKASSSETLTNPSKIVAVSNAAMSALTVDEKTNPYTLLTMALAFKSATGSNGISGSVYWSDPDYYVDGVGSSVLLDDAKNTELFNQLADGTYKAGTVGNLAEG